MQRRKSRAFGNLISTSPVPVPARKIKTNDGAGDIIVVQDCCDDAEVKLADPFCNKQRLSVYLSVDFLKEKVKLCILSVIIK